MAQTIFTQEKISQIEQEFEDTIPNLLYYFKDPENDRFGYGLRNADILEMFGIDKRHNHTYERICKRFRVCLSKEKRRVPPHYEDVALTKFDNSIYGYLSSRCRWKTVKEMAFELETTEEIIANLLNKYKLTNMDKFIVWQNDEVYTII